MDRMATHDPTFCDITWGAGGTTADLTLEIASKMQNMVCTVGNPASYVVQHANHACQAFHSEISSVSEMTQRIYCLQICVETMMHLTCTNMPQDKLSQALDKVSNTAVAQHAVLQLICVHMQAL